MPSQCVDCHAGPHNANCIVQEFLLLILPLFNSRTFRRTYKQALARVKSVSILPRSLLSKDSVQETRRQSQGPFFALSPDQCAICAEDAKYNFNSSAADMFRADATPASDQLEAESHDFASDGPPKYPITIPYRASCGDIYCYCCITERLVRGVDDGEYGWLCLRCGETVKDCKRLSAIADDDESSSRTSFSLSDDDLSSFDGDT
jgi:peroxin-2